MQEIASASTSTVEASGEGKSRIISQPIPMRRIQVVLLAIFFCTCVHGQELTTTTPNSSLVGRNTNRQVSRRTHRDLGKTSNGGKPRAVKGKGKASAKLGGTSNSNADADFFGFQPSSSKPQQQQQPPLDPSTEDDSTSSDGVYSVDSIYKSSKKSKKSKNNDSSKQSHKLSKKSRSSSSKGNTPSSPLHPTFPTAPPTFSPTHDGAINPTSSPTTSGSMHLTPFALEYIVTEDDRIPFRSELLEVVELTRAYLNTYFQEFFEGITNVTLSEFFTVFIDTQSDFGDSIYIAYRSSAIFDASDSILSSIQELDSQLRQAFLGRNLDGYLGMLQGLAPSNLFSTAIFVTQVAVRQERQSLSAVASAGIRTKTSADGQNAMAGVAAGVTCMTLIGAAGLFFRRQSRTVDHRCSEKYDGDATSITIGSWSLDHTTGLQPMNGSARHTLT